ncbi:hypothetical protein D3C72_1852790 [compost metagenome]
MIDDSRVHTDEAVVANRHPARNDNMRRYKDVILNNRVVPDVITTPKRDIITDPAKWLQGIVFEDKTIIADLIG